MPTKTTHPTESVALWNKINPSCPAQLIDDNTKWFEPSITSYGIDPSQHDIASELIRIFNQTGVIILDGDAPGNFISDDEKVICTNIDTTIELEKKLEKELEAIPTQNMENKNNKIKEVYDTYFAGKNSDDFVVQTTKALLYLKLNEPELQNADILIWDQELINTFSAAYEKNEKVDLEGKIDSYLATLFKENPNLEELKTFGFSSRQILSLPIRNEAALNAISYLKNQPNADPAKIISEIKNASQEKINVLANKYLVLPNKDTDLKADSPKTEKFQEVVPPEVERFQEAYKKAQLKQIPAQSIASTPEKKIELSVFLQKLIPEGMATNLFSQKAISTFEESIKPKQLSVKGGTENNSLTTNATVLRDKIYAFAKETIQLGYLSKHPECKAVISKMNEKMASKKEFPWTDEEKNILRDYKKFFKTWDKTFEKEFFNALNPPTEEQPTRTSEAKTAAKTEPEASLNKEKKMRFREAQSIAEKQTAYTTLQKNIIAEIGKLPELKTLAAEVVKNLRHRIGASKQSAEIHEIIKNFTDKSLTLSLESKEICNRCMTSLREHDKKYAAAVNENTPGVSLFNADTYQETWGKNEQGEYGNFVKPIERTNPTAKNKAIAAQIYDPINEIGEILLTESTTEPEPLIVIPALANEIRPALEEDKKKLAHDIIFCKTDGEKSVLTNLSEKIMGQRENAALCSPEKKPSASLNLLQFELEYQKEAYKLQQKNGGAFANFLNPLKEKIAAIDHMINGLNKLTEFVDGAPYSSTWEPASEALLKKAPELQKLTTEFKLLRDKLHPPQDNWDLISHPTE